jgi:hypothetical protein
MNEETAYIVIEGPIKYDPKKYDPIFPDWTPVDELEDLIAEAVNKFRARYPQAELEINGVS